MKKLNIDKYINKLSHIGKNIDEDFRITNINTEPPAKPLDMDDKLYLKQIVEFTQIQRDCYKYLLKRTNEELSKIIK